MENQKPNQKQEIKIADNIPGAEYANAMQSRFNKDEFQLLFFNLMGASGRVSSKIITSPGHFKKMIAAMNTAVKNYEEKFGEIKEVESINKEIGFKA